MTGRRGRRRRTLLDNLKVSRGYSHLKEKALDRNIWSVRFGRGFETFVRETINELIIYYILYDILYIFLYYIHLYYIYLYIIYIYILHIYILYITR